MPDRGDDLFQASIGTHAMVVLMMMMVMMVTMVMMLVMMLVMMMVMKFKEQSNKLSTGLFWTCILEQPRVEFDTPLFQYTGPEQPRVN